MQLKNYQQQAIEQLDRWLDALKDARLKGEKVGKVLEESGVDVPETLKKLSECRMARIERPKQPPRYFTRR